MRAYASIGGVVGSEASTNNQAGALSFKTTSNVASIALTERMNISKTGAIRFNAYGAGTLVTDASGNVTASSDTRLKDVQGEFNRGLSDLLNLDPILYKWNGTSGMETGSTYAGFSAQNVQLAIPEAVSTDSRGYLTLQDRPILATSVNAIKELNTTIQSLDSRVTALEAATGANPDFASLNVTGHSTLVGLTVTGNVAIQGKLTVASAEVSGSLTVGGRLITRGASPVIETGVVLGQSAAEVSGTPTSGTISFTPGQSGAAGETLVKVTLPEGFAYQPHVLLTPASGATAGLNIYYELDMASGAFVIKAGNVAQFGVTYSFSYFIIESTAASN